MEPKKMTCKRCNHVWSYEGKKLGLMDRGIPLYVGCPKCKTSVRLNEEIGGEENGIGKQIEPENG